MSENPTLDGLMKCLTENKLSVFNESESDAWLLGKPMDFDPLPNLVLEKILAGVEEVAQRIAEGVKNPATESFSWFEYDEKGNPIPHSGFSSWIIAKSDQSHHTSGGKNTSEPTKKIIPDPQNYDPIP